MNIKLYQLDRPLKKLIASFLTLLSISLIVGLVFLSSTTNSSVQGTVERWNGSTLNDDNEFELMTESYAKPVGEMLLTTHNHLFGFALIFISIGMVFYFNSTISGSLKNFLMIEPFLSAVLTFGSIWLMRFVDEAFVYIAVISAITMYGSYFTMYTVCIYELLFRNSSN